MTDQRYDPATLENFVRDSLYGESDAAGQDPEIDQAAIDAAEEALWSSMSPTQRARAEVDPAYLALLAESFTGVPANAAGAETDAEEGDAGDAATDFVPQSAAELVQWAELNEPGLQAVGWKDAGEFLVEAATNVRWWQSAAAELGFDPRIKPEQQQLPHELQMEALAAGVNRAFADERARSGAPVPDNVQGAKVVDNEFKSGAWGRRPPRW